MQSKTTLALFALTWLTFTGCREEQNHQVQVDLIERLSYAEKISDTQTILPGTASAKSALLSGWTTPATDREGPFVKAIAPKASFAFHLNSGEPLYLHLKLSGSQDVASAQVFLNSHPAGTINLNQEPDIYTIPLSPKDLSSTNVIALQFAGAGVVLRQATISSSKYVVSDKENLPANSFYHSEWMFVGNKKEPVLVTQTGGSFLYYEDLNRNAKLQFGYYYHPYAFSEQDDYSAFSIYLKKDGEAERRIFYKRATEEALGYESIDLSSFIPNQKSSLYEIEFRTERNTIYDSGKTAWIRPVLVQDPLPQPDYSRYTEQMQALRKANRGANVVLLLLDAGAAGHFGTYGYFRNTTPVTDQLAREGVQFNQAYTQAVYTLASTASLMSGLYPFHHRVLYLKDRLSSDVFTMAEAFRSGGYQTGTFVANGNASTTFGMTQGFQQIREVFRDKNYTGWGQDITDSFSKWLDTKPPGKFFAYLHYREPHAPFNPPKEWLNEFLDPNYKGGANASFEFRQKVNLNQDQFSQADKDYVISLYDANLNYGDYQIGLVVKKLKELGIYNNTIIIVTADHGEAFWQHGFQGHNGQLYQESIHIPMVIKLVKNSPVLAKRVPAVTRTIDYYPTLVDLLDLSRRYMDVDGRSFLPYFVSAPSDGREAITQTVMERAFSYLWSDCKYLAFLESHGQELFDLKRDPLELHNLIQIEPVRTGFYRSRLFGEISASKKLNDGIKSSKL